LITVHDTQLPGLQCNIALAAACASWTSETCEIWASQSGPGAVWSVVSSLMSSNQIIGHEAMHCWLHNYHGTLS
jgi:fatty acid desaturase